MVKKRICVIFLVLILLATTALAGDVDKVFMNDEAVIFFGKVTAYDKATQSATVVPTKKIKGEVELETEQTFEVYFQYSDQALLHNRKTGKSEPNRFDEFLLETDATFVMAYGDDRGIMEDGRILYVFKVSGTDPKTAKIEYSVYQDYLITADLQTHLNNGDYERAGAERLQALEQVNTSPNVMNNNFYLYIGLGGAVILLVCAGVFVVKRRSKQ